VVRSRCHEDDHGLAAGVGDGELMVTPRQWSLLYVTACCNVALCSTLD
jgi:hypothetical protein